MSRVIVLQRVPNATLDTKFADHRPAEVYQLGLMGDVGPPPKAAITYDAFVYRSALGHGYWRSTQTGGLFTDRDRCAKVTITNLTGDGQAYHWPVTIR